MNSNEKLAYLRSLPGETISPKELAMVAGGSPYSYNLAAKEGKLDLPHLWRGRNLRIWKGPVIRLIGGQDVQAVSDGQRQASEGKNDHRGYEGTEPFDRGLCGVWFNPDYPSVGSNVKSHSSTDT